VMASLADGNSTFTAIGPSTSGIGGKGAGCGETSRGGTAAAGATDEGGLAVGFAGAGAGG
jgi:hypothetical protein